MAGTVVSETCDDRNLTRASKAETAQPVAEPNGRDWLRENMEFVSRLLHTIRLIFLRTAARLWRPVSPPPRETIFRRLALKIRGRLDEPRAIPVLESFVARGPTLVVLSSTREGAPRPDARPWAHLGPVVFDTRKPDGRLCDRIYRLCGRPDCPP